MCPRGWGRHTQRASAAVISLTPPLFPHGEAGGERELSCVQQIHWSKHSWYPCHPFFQSSHSLLQPVLHPPCNWDAVRLRDICHGVLPWDYRMIHGWNCSWWLCMHKGIYKKHSVICLTNITPRKYLSLIFPAKLHVLDPPHLTIVVLSWKKNKKLWWQQ